MGSSLKVNIKMVKKMERGQAGGTMIKHVRKCRVPIKPGKWVISGIFIITKET